jgi:hypothetical protein
MAPAIAESFDDVVLPHLDAGYRLARRPFQLPTDPFEEAQLSGARPASDPEALLLHTDDITLNRLVE